jgi:cytochrome P450
MINRWRLLLATPGIMRNPLAFLVKASREYGDVVQFDVGSDQAVILVNHPAAIERVLVENHRNYTKQTIQFETFGLVTGNGLLNSDGAFWLQQRRIAQPAFHRRQLDEFGSLITNHAQQLAAAWRADHLGQAPIDVEEEMLRLSLPIICEALFGYDVRERTEEIVQAIAHALDYVMFRARVFLPIPRTWPLRINRDFQAGMELLDAFVDELIATRQQSGREEGDLLGLLLGVRDADTGEAMPLQHVRDEVLTAIVAGFETVASGMTWIWYLLDQHPDVAARLHAELDRELEGRPPALSDLMRLPYLNQVIKEAWRLYPPSWLISRRAQEDDELLGQPVRAGSLIVISPYVIHRHAAYWPEPERFDPDRFAEGQGGSETRYAYIPFGGGPRLCIGNRFAEMEAQLVIATLAQHFTLRLAAGQSVATVAQVTIRPQGGLRMHIEPRPASAPEPPLPLHSTLPEP